MGRRLYIHRNSFDFLSHQDVEICNAVEGALGRVRVMKLIRHYCYDNWIPLGLIAKQDAEMAEGPFHDAFENLTKLLREVDHETVAGGCVVRVLDNGDAIVSSCYEGGYFTFATDPASAEAMYEDHVPLAELWSDVRVGSGPTDLTMTRGPRLFAQRTQLSAIPSHRLRKRQLAVTPAVHQSVKRSVRASLVAELGSTANGSLGELADELTSAVGRALDATRCEICGQT